MTQMKYDSSMNICYLSRKQLCN